MVSSQYRRMTLCCQTMRHSASLPSWLVTPCAVCLENLAILFAGNLFSDRIGWFGVRKDEIPAMMSCFWCSYEDKAMFKEQEDLRFSPGALVLRV